MQWLANNIVGLLGLVATVILGALASGWQPTGPQAGTYWLVLRVVLGLVAVCLLVFPVRLWAWQRIRPSVAAWAAFRLEENQNCEELGYHIQGRMDPEKQYLFSALTQRPFPLREAQVYLRIRPGNQGGLVCGLDINRGRTLLYRLCITTDAEGLLRVRKDDGTLRTVEVPGAFAVDEWHTLLIRRSAEGVEYAIDGAKMEQQGPRWPRRVMVGIGVSLAENTNHSAYVRRPSLR